MTERIMINSGLNETTVKILKPNLLNIYPRIMGNPSQRRIVNNSKERDEYIKNYGTNRPIYISVYAFTKIIKDNLHAMHKHAKVSHLVFDFDPDDCPDVYAEMMRFHKYLADYIHRISLSGRGYHEYEWIKENLLYPKVAMANYWDFLHGDKKGEYINPFKPDKEYESPQFKICKSTRGDLGQIIRYPNSRHFGVGCYCITVDRYILQKYHSLEEMQKFASKPYIPRSKIYFGSRRLDIKDFDCTPEQYKELPEGHLKLAYMTYGDVDTNNDVDVDLEDLPYCIDYMINHEELHFPTRNEVIKFFINRLDTIIPYNAADVMGILKRISTNNRWLRWFFSHNQETILYRNVKVVYDNQNVLSGCYNIRQMGFCERSQCKWKSVTEK